MSYQHPMDDHTGFAPPETRCKRCGDKYHDFEDDDGHGTGLCYECFECALEEHEEAKRGRIARENEY